MQGRSLGRLSAKSVDIHSPKVEKLFSPNFCRLIASIQDGVLKQSRSHLEIPALPSRQKA